MTPSERGRKPGRKGEKSRGAAVLRKGSDPGVAEFRQGLEQVVQRRSADTIVRPSAALSATTAESRAALARRLGSYVHLLVARAPDVVVSAALAERSPAESLARLIDATKYGASVSAAATALGPALWRGAHRKRALLAATETLAPGEFAKTLRITPFALSKHIARGRVLALPVGRTYRLPVFQLDPRRKLIHAGLKRLFLAAVARAIDPWMLLELLTTPVRDFENATLVELARGGRLEEALTELMRFGMHRA